MKNRNIKFAKGVTSMAIFVNGIMLLLFLIFNLKPQRAIEIEAKHLHGVVVINGVKHPVPYILTKTKLKCAVENPIDFLLLSSEDGESFLSAAAKLGAIILLGLFFWKIDFDDPFNKSNLPRVYALFWLVIIAIIANFCSDLYTGHYIKEHLHGSEFQYSSSPRVYSLYIITAIMNLAIYLYVKAVRNQQELDMTI